MTKVKRILVDPDKCEACYSCILACMVHSDPEATSIHDIDLTKPQNAKNHIEIASGRAVPMVCNHCAEPQCVLTCMSGAMTKDSRTGIVHHDSEQCAQCYMCVMACPFGILKQDNYNDEKILKCDLCEDEDQPLCAAWCPTGALSVIEVDLDDIE